MQLFSVIKERRLPLIIEAAQRMMAERNERLPAKIYIEVDGVKEDTAIRSADNEKLTKEEKIYCGII